MANYRAVATGNWSNLAIWQDDASGSYVASSVLPGAGDVVYANGFTVTLDIDVAVQEVRTTTGVNVVAGGNFTFGGGNILTANVFAGTSIGVSNAQTAGKTINGNIVGATAGGSAGVQHQSSGTLIINGNATGGTAGTAPGVINTSSGTVIINGNVTGGSEINSWGVNNASIGSAIVNGTAFGGTAAVEGANNASSGVLRVTTAQGSDAAAGVRGVLVTGTAIVTNLVWSSNGRIPLVGFVKFDNTAAKSVTVVLESGATELLTDNSVVNYPAESEVLAGVQFGANNIFTGTLVVSGLTAADVWNYALSNGFASGSIGESLAGVRIRTDKIPDFPASVQTTGDQIASFEV